MNEIGQTHRNPTDRTIIYHFDMEQHRLPLSQFLQTATATQKIVTNFNRFLFKDSEKIELRVGPPEPGGLIELLEVVVEVGKFTIATLESDLGKAIIKELTNHSPVYWMRAFCRMILGRKRIDSFEQRNLQDLDKQELVEFVKSFSENDPAVQDALRQLQAAVLAAITTRYLEASTTELKQMNFPESGFKRAQSAKDYIYQACMDNPDVNGLNLNRSSNFRTKKSDFPHFISEPKFDMPKEPVFRPNEHLEIANVTVHSPNWNRNGRGWEGRTSKLKKVEFWIDDELFWQHVERKKVNFGMVVKMNVEWVRHVTSSNHHKAHVLKVLSFNGSELLR